MEDFLNLAWSWFVVFARWLGSLVDPLLVGLGIPVNLVTEYATLAVFTFLLWQIILIVVDLFTMGAREEPRPQTPAERKTRQRAVRRRGPSRLRRLLAFLGRTGRRVKGLSERGINLCHRVVSALYDWLRSLDEKLLIILGVATLIILNIPLGIAVFAQDVGMTALRFEVALLLAPPVLYVILWVTRGLGWFAGRVFSEITEEEARVTPELSSSTFTPAALVTYHEVVNLGRGQKERTGRDFRGFLSDLQTFVLLINGKGFLFEQPRRLRKHQSRLVSAKGDKEIQAIYSELEVFTELIGKAPGERFSWRDSMYVLIDYEEAEAVIHGSHGHLRNVSMAPDGAEEVRLWLAEGIEIETEMLEGQERVVDVKRTGEFLLVEETISSWGVHSGVLAAWAWIGEELNEEEMEEARAILAEFGPDDIIPVPPAQMEAYFHNSPKQGALQ